jgi:hypothetical protein
MYHLPIRAWPSDLFPYVKKRRSRGGGARGMGKDLAEEEGIFDCLACACAIMREGLRRTEVSGILFVKSDDAYSMGL